MQIVIDIDDEIFNKLPEAELGSNIIEDVLEAVENGIILPIRYGQSIDADIIINEFYERYPKNYMGGLELGGSSCVFSYNDIIEIINNILNKRVE